ncbi:MAG: DHH family phosphoesterase, partial [Lachnospiraceae bacterium]|nr:DHH family phosphoesterase [Lachnospiraceae bacterium]
MEKWYLYCKKADFAAISQKFNITPMLARIIRNRDICEDDQLDEYLNGSKRDMHDPFLLKGMEQAVALIDDAVKAGKKIRIIGDYDVDGVCASYILRTYLTFYGAKADVRLPDRILEGYGMNVSMADEASHDGISLIITCDNGVSSYDAVARARELGIDVLITDHHEIPKQLPPANIIIDPKQPDCGYPFKDICGGAVAYKLVAALSKNIDESRK